MYWVGTPRRSASTTLNALRGSWSLANHGWIEGVRHAEGCQDLVVHELDVALAGHRLDEGRGNGEAIITIDAHVAGRILEPRHGERLEDLIQISRHGRTDVGITIIGSRKAGRVVEEHPDGDVPIFWRHH